MRGFHFLLPFIKLNSVTAFLFILTVPDIVPDCHSAVCFIAFQNRIVLNFHLEKVKKQPNLYWLLSASVRLWTVYILFDIVFLWYYFPSFYKIFKIFVLHYNTVVLTPKGIYVLCTIPFLLFWLLFVRTIFGLFFLYLFLFSRIFLFFDTLVRTLYNTSTYMLSTIIFLSHYFRSLYLVFALLYFSNAVTKSFLIYLYCKVILSQILSPPYLKLDVFIHIKACYSPSRTWDLIFAEETIKTHQTTIRRVKKNFKTIRIS